MNSARSRSWDPRTVAGGAAGVYALIEHRKQCVRILKTWCGVMQRCTCSPVCDRLKAGIASC